MTEKKQKAIYLLDYLEKVIRNEERQRFLRLLDDAEKDEELFFKFAMCSGCHMKTDYCKCGICEPIMMLAQFNKAKEDLFCVLRGGL